MKETYTIQQYLEMLDSKEMVVEAASLPEHMRVDMVSCNSKEVQPNTIFICKGAHFRTAFLEEAISRGAICYISETKFDVDAPCILVKDIRKTMFYISEMYYQRVWEKLKLIGLTGTKGKSTTVYFVKYILDTYLKNQKKALSGIISSIDTYDGKTTYESHITTPEAMDLHKLFNTAVEHDVEFMEMEVSSQALKYDRVMGIDFDVTAFLNIGYDHISSIEHSDFDDYFQSKLRIFEQSKYACINLDMDHLDQVLEASKACKNIVTFSQHDKTADVYASNIRKDKNDILFRVKTKRYDRDFRIMIPGLFNVQNALAAIAICEVFDIPEHDIYVGLMKARVSGRMEVYENGDGSIVSIVDYAHNALSFEKLFSSVKEEYPNHNIHIVFGCPGYKALDRRKDLGEIAGKYADKVFLTEEDAGEEPVMDICQEIADHVKSVDGNYSIIIDRGEAIKKAIVSAKENTIVLVTGKGNETRQKRGTKYIDVPSDVTYVKEALKTYDVEHNLNNIDKINSFISLLPQLQQYSGQTVLIKYGGSAMEEKNLITSVLEDISTLQLVGVRVILVHGGGKEITHWIEQLGVETEFYQGYRVTDEKTIDVAQMVLSGHVNKNIVQSLEDMNVSSIGVSGKDGGLLLAKPKLVDGKSIGLVGEIERVNPDLLTVLLDNGYVPVISPIGRDTKGNTYNINADDAAYAIAQALKVDKLVFLTNTDGILVDGDNEDTTIRSMNISRAKGLISSGFISGGMGPKVQNCIKAIENDVKKVVILDGRKQHSLVLEFLEKNKHGTTITNDK